MTWEGNRGNLSGTAVLSLLATGGREASTAPPGHHLPLFPSFPFSISLTIILASPHQPGVTIADAQSRPQASRYPRSRPHR